MTEIIGDLNWSKAEDPKNLYSEKYRAFGDRMGVYTLLRRKKISFMTVYVGSSYSVLDRIRALNNKNFSRFKFATISIRGMKYCPIEILQAIEHSLIYTMQPSMNTLMRRAKSKEVSGTT